MVVSKVKWTVVYLVVKKVGKMDVLKAEQMVGQMVGN